MPLQPDEPPSRRRPQINGERPSALARAQGTARASTTTRWIAVGGFAGVGLLTALAAVSTAHATSPPTPPATDAPATDDPAPTSAPETIGATAPAAPTPAPTARAKTPAVTGAPATTPTTIAPAAQPPATVPRTRHRTPAATSGSS